MVWGGSSLNSTKYVNSTIRDYITTYTHTHLCTDTYNSKLAMINDDYMVMSKITKIPYKLLLNNENIHISDTI